MANARPPLLYQHVVAKHPAGTDPVTCFAQLKGYDPNDPKGEKSKPSDATGGAPKPKKAAAKKKDVNLDALLDAGLTAGKKGKK